MNRILDLDEKNMCILVEPYVSFAQVQAVAMRAGLNTNIIGAGSETSYCASFTSVVGNNSQAVSQGYSGRNLLGVEWVLPTGEIVRLGSPGSGAGWFSGDGPGPSLRGVMRGASGAGGALGVFTKCAGHLHPWPGDTRIEVKGISPDYEAILPPFSEYHVLDWPTWEKCADGLYKIGESGIGYALHKTGGPGSHASCVTGSNDEYYERWEEFKDLPEISWSIVTAGSTEREHNYQVDVLNKILEETDGRITPVGENPTWKKRDYLTLIRACFIPRLAFRLTGGFTVDGIVGTESVDNCALGLKMDKAHRDKYAEKGILGDDGTYNSWGTVYEGSHFALVECGHEYDPADKESTKGMAEMVEEGTQISLTTPFSLSWTASGPKEKKVAPLCYNFDRWKRKIKQTLDPNMVSDATRYAPEE
jgi:glycolate oxidase